MPQVEKDMTGSQEASHKICRGRYYEKVVKSESADELRRILENDVAARAIVKSDAGGFNPREPFIKYKPMNLNPETWVALALGKLARKEMELEDGEDLVLVGAPRSAIWIAKEIKRHKIFPKADSAQVTKDADEIEGADDLQAVKVLSYVHNRQANGTRGFEKMFFANPGLYSDRKVLVLDDVVAEGETVLGMAEALKEFGAREVYVSVVLSKLMQRGSRRLSESPLVDRLVEGVRVRTVEAPGVGKLSFAG